MEGFADQLLVGVRAVHVGGVDECHAGVDDVAQQRDPAVVVGVIAPHLVTGQSHRAEADPADGQVASDRHGFRDRYDCAHIQVPFVVTSGGVKLRRSHRPRKGLVAPLSQTIHSLSSSGPVATVTGACQCSPSVERET